MKTTIDWFCFRTQSNPFETFEKMRPVFGTARDLVTLDTGHKGKDGWLRAAEIKLDSMTLGRIDYDGESQRGWVRVNLTGEGCGWVQDWKAAEGLIDALTEAEIRRLDIALTTYQGEVTHDMVIAAHAQNKFCSGGRQPHYRCIGGSDPRAGQTVYVGKREGSDKMLRCYEKGFEMLSKVPEPFRRTTTHIDFDFFGRAEIEKVYRVEVEFKANEKIIPWTALFTARDEVFAGAYPFCAELLPGVQVVKFPTMPNFGPIAKLETSLDHCRRAYGGILRAAVMAHGGDEEKVFKRILSREPSRALIDAGVLTVDHF